MPMFHDPDRGLEEIEVEGIQRSPAPERRRSEESIRTEFCDGPLLDETERESPLEQVEPHHEIRREISDRAELIERLKRGESPTWVPTRKQEVCSGLFQDSQLQPLISQAKTTSLLPAIELRTSGRPLSDRDTSRQLSASALSHPSEIQRPRSALHAGDFTEDARTLKENRRDFGCVPSNPGQLSATSPTSNSPPHQWPRPNLTGLSNFEKDPRFSPPHGVPIQSDGGPMRSRAPSLHSYSLSFIVKPPTSPLVQQSNNDDLDFSSIDYSTSPSKSSRRHTLPPQSLSTLRSLPDRQAPAASQAARHLMPVAREGSSPISTHCSRRSLTSSFSLQTSTSPKTPAHPSSRRPSFSSDASPLLHASMVGSYEESILRGRMSTVPSKPLDFTAQIGVLGKGNFKPKYPAHVTVPFPAVYYSWNNGVGRNASIIDNEPSPYVGHIDLEHSLAPAEVKERPRRRKDATLLDDHEASGDTESNHEHDVNAVNLAIRKREKRKRRSESPKAPPGGSYRIPQQGQLQIVIRNPNKTAVKLFLVPYDLTGMDGGTKTFLRQRCYSAGPIIECPLTSRSISESGIDSKAAILDAKNKPTLRYLIHLNICCPSKGRFYLYQSIRVVFANRVPDNKEKLQNDIQLPEPRYSTYKPQRESQTGASSAGAKLLAEKAQRRRSYGFGSTFGPAAFDAMDGLSSQSLANGNTFPFNDHVPTPPVPSIPFGFVKAMKENSPDVSMNHCEPMDLDVSRPTSSGLQSPLCDQKNRLGSKFSSSYLSSSSNSSDTYSKLKQGESGYGGIFGRPGTPEPGEGLLARRLRGLGMERELGMNGDES